MIRCNLPLLNFLSGSTAEFQIEGIAPTTVAVFLVQQECEVAE